MIFKHQDEDDVVIPGDDNVEEDLIEEGEESEEETEEDTENI